MSIEEILLKDNEYKAIAEANNYRGASFDSVKFVLQAPSPRVPELQQKIDERWDQALKQNPNMRNNPAIAVDLQSMGVIEQGHYRSLVEDSFHRKAGEREVSFLKLGIYESCYRDMFATSREYADQNSVFLVGSKGLCLFFFEGRKYSLFGLRNAGHDNIKGRTQAIPAGMMDKKDLNASLNQQLETLRREYGEEVESEKLANGTLGYNSTLDESWRGLKATFPGFSLHPTLGSFDADYILVNNNPKWAYQHKIIPDGYLLRLEKKEGRFPEHEVVFGVPLESIPDFIREKQEKIAVASRWLLKRAIELGEIPCSE